MANFLRPTAYFLKTLSNSTELAQRNWIRRASRASQASYQQTLLNLSPTRVTVLDNGLRVATEDTASTAATVGLWIYSGSRFEKSSVSGVANLFERLALKGSKKRSQADLEVEVENFGAKIGAYTSREQTAFYATCAPQDVPKLVEILSDIIQNSKLDEADVERERSAVLNELNSMQENNMRGVIFDYLHATAFQQTPLASSVLGDTQSVKSITRQDIVDYVSVHMKAPRIVLAGAGGIEHESLVQLAENNFKDMSGSYLGDAPIVNPCRYTGSELTLRDDSRPFAHIAVAVQGVPRNHPDYLALAIASNLIGSWDVTYGGGVNNASVLSQAAAVTNTVYSFDSFNISYKDTGLWGTYFICDQMNINEFVNDYLQPEWRRICTRLIDLEVERAKNILRTKLLLQTKSSLGTCEDIGTQILSCGRRQPFHELDAAIQGTTTQMVQDACYRHIYDNCPAVAAVGPIEQLANYYNTRSGMRSLLT